MAEFREDTGIYPVLIALAAGTEAELVSSGLGDRYITTVQPGQTPVIDYVGLGKECAEIIVNLVQAYPSSIFPNPDPTGACGIQLAYEVQVGVMRCAPPMGGTKAAPKPPTPAEVLNSARQHTADMAAVHRAICKVLRPTRQYAIATFAPYGPEGNAVGGTWTVVVGGVTDD